MEQAGKKSGNRYETFKSTLPLRTVSAANAREHWAVRARRTKSERSAIACALREMPASFVLFGGKINITLTRYGKRLLDDDNLAGSFKAIRDEIAKQLDRDDNPKSGLSWTYRQQVGKVYAVGILIEMI